VDAYIKEKKMSLKLKYDDKNIEIRFEHRQHGATRLQNSEETISRPMSIATLLVNGNIKYFAQSICHPDDNFSKRRGRKIALKRAIKYLDKSTRTAIWKAYLKCMKF
jgi:hypothetical protein